MDEEKEDIGERLKTFRLSKKVRQQDMSDALGCNISTYNRYESSGVMTTKDLTQLYYMGCNINWLLTGKEKMKINQEEDDNTIIKICKEQSETMKEQAEALREQAEALDKQADAIKEQAATLLNNSNTIREHTQTMNIVIAKCQQRVNMDGFENNQENSIISISNNRYGNRKK